MVEHKEAKSAGVSRREACRDSVAVHAKTTGSWLLTPPQPPRGRRPIDPGSAAPGRPGDPTSRGPGGRTPRTPRLLSPSAASQIPDRLEHLHRDQATRGHDDVVASVAFGIGVERTVGDMCAVLRSCVLDFTHGQRPAPRPRSRFLAALSLEERGSPDPCVIGRRAREGRPLCSAMRRVAGVRVHERSNQPRVPARDPSRIPSSRCT